MDNKEFWKVYFEHLEMVAGLAGEFLFINGANSFVYQIMHYSPMDGYITVLKLPKTDLRTVCFSENELLQDEEDEDDGCDKNRGSGRMWGRGTEVIESGDVGVLFLDQLEQLDSLNDRTDFTNFRNLLWRAMVQFPDRVESRSRELTPLLLRFIRCV